MLQEELTYLTREGYQKFEEELNYLSNQRREEIAAELRDVETSSDSEDVTEYEMIKAEQAFVEGRIRELRFLLATARVIKDDEIYEYVQIGSRVTIQEESYPPEVYRIVGPAEANPVKGLVSHRSPLGRALMDHKAGDRVMVASPDGAFEVQILEVK